VFFVFCRADDNDHGVRWGDTAQALVWWQHLGASNEATNVLHRSMCFAPYSLLGDMVVKIAVK
jgi:hypothetical protein